MTAQNPTGVFVRLPLSDEQIKAADQIAKEIAENNTENEWRFARHHFSACDELAIALGTPVQGGDFNQSRGCFEAFYAEMCTKATGCLGVTTDYVRGLRCGDNYGGRAFLNNIWEAWPDFVQRVTPILAARDAEIVRLRGHLERIDKLIMGNSDPVMMFCGIHANCTEALKGGAA